MPRDDAFQPSIDELDQGDIFSDVPFPRWRDGAVEPGNGTRGVITSHGCACEDYDRALAQGRTQAANKLMLQVAPLRSATDFPEQRLQQIASGEYYDRFLLYGDDQALGDQVLDFTKEQGIPAYVIARCNRIARIADWQWDRLLIHLTVSRFHQRPEDLFREGLIS